MPDPPLPLPGSLPGALGAESGRVAEAVEGGARKGVEHTRLHAASATWAHEDVIRWALEASGAGVWTLDPRTRRGDWDDRMRAQYRMSATPSFAAWIASLHEDDRSRVVARIEQVMGPRGEDAWDIEFRVVRGDGSVAWMHALGRATRDANGEVAHITGLNFDVTARKEVEVERHSAMTRLRALVGAAAGVWEWDARTDEIVWDDQIKVIHGLGPDEPASFEAWASRVHPDDRERVFGHLERVRQTWGDNQLDVEFRVVHPDGKVVWTHGIGRAERDRDGGVTVVTGLGLDVTARREAAAHAKSAEDRLQSFVDATSDVLYSMSADGQELDFIAPAAEQVYGRPRQAFYENPTLPLDAVHPDDLSRIRHAYDARFTTDAFDETYRIVRPDGGVRWLHHRAHPVRTAEGEVVRFEGVARDVTDKMAVELELEQSHAALRERAAQLERQTYQLRRLASELTLAEQRAREQLARTLHDGLQQLLFSVGLHLDRAIERIGHDVLLDRARDEAHGAISAARSLSKELHPPALRAGDLPAALAWLAEWVHERYGVTVQVRADPGANPEHDDLRILLFESVRELLFNAVKHAQVDRVDVELAVRDGNLSITVADDGLGFDPEATSKASREYHGGLGLFGIRERVTLLGGRFDVDSSPGRGTCFTLDVPFRSLDQPAGPRCSDGATFANVSGLDDRDRAAAVGDPAVIAQLPK